MKRGPSPPAGPLARPELAARAVRGITTGELRSIANLPRAERLSLLSTLAGLASRTAPARRTPLPEA